jgi:broad specificity phosphatase PhoE
MQKASKLILLLLAVAVVSCSSPQQRSTVVLLVRHAEKASDAEDSPLTEAGRQRALALVGVAEEAGVSAVYTSQFKRSHETAGPLAERLKVAVTEFPVDLQNPGDYGKRLAGEIIGKHSGRVVVVVGHGNTIASTVEGLTGRAASPGDIRYSDLFVVSIHPSGPATLIKAQYGAATPDSSMMK